MKYKFSPNDRPTNEEICKYFGLILLFFTFIAFLTIKIFSSDSLKLYYVFLFIGLITWFPYFIFKVIRNYHFFRSLKTSLTDIENVKKIQQILEKNAIKYSTNTDFGNIFLVQERQKNFFTHSYTEFTTTIICNQHEILMISRPLNRKLMVLENRLVVSDLIVKEYSEKITYNLISK